MIEKRVIALIAIFAMLIPMAACSSQSQDSSSNSTSTYETKLFDTSSVHKIDVEISDDDWEDLLANSTDKTKYEVNVTIDGDEIDDVSFATKGNTSLTQVANSDSERYSFKINFGKYVDGQTYYGLDKLALNNLISDDTYMKDYLSYRIMAEAGVASPLVSYVSLSINGEEKGLYLAVEELSDSFLERNYGEDYGQLYKPETEQLNNADNNQGGGKKDQSADDATDSDISSADSGETTDNTTTSDSQIAKSTNQPNMQNGGPGGQGGGPGGMGGGPGGQGGMSGQSSGADLKYTDDDLDSYSDIFDNAETDADEEDEQRVVDALKQLSTGEDLDSCVDIEQTLRYFAVHNFLINDDSYTGSMLHNYYLYEDEGKLTMLPWDYNLAFGGFGGSSSDATSIINRPINTPLTGSEDDRPMWTQLVADDENLKSYDKYMDELLTNYFESGDFEKEVNQVYEMIRPYVKEDPTAFYTVDQFDTAIETLKEFCNLRVQSIRGQLDGTIPSTTEGQKADSSSLIDAGDLDISAMGSQGGDKGGNDGNGQHQQRQDGGQMPSGEPGGTSNTTSDTNTASDQTSKTSDS